MGYKFDRICRLAMPGSLFPALFVALIFFGCAPPGAKPPLPKSPAAGAVDPLFSKAEALYAAQDFDQALDLYLQYLASRPGGRYVPWALRRTAGIYRLQAKPELALDAYKRFLERFGQSPMAEQVRIEMLALLLEQQRYADVIDGAISMLDKTGNSKSIKSLWSLLAQAYTAIGDAADAAYYYHKLLTVTKGLERETNAAGLEKAISRLSRSEAEMLMDPFADPFSRSRLMYRLARAMMEDSLYDEALEVLNRFQRLYPGHVLSGDVTALIEKIEQKFAFEPYSLGCMLPLSGPYRGFGQRALDGIELALDQVAKQLGKAPLRLLIKDTGGVAEVAVKAVEDLVNQKVGLIIGPAFTADAAAAKAQQLQVPLITLTQKSGLAATGNYVFRNFMTPAMQVEALVGYAIEKLNVKNFAILYPDDNYGNTLMELFWDQVVADGGRVVGAESYKAGQTDFAEPIARITGTYYKIPEQFRRRPPIMVDRPADLPLDPGKRKGHLNGAVADSMALWTGMYWDDTLWRGEKRADKQDKKPVVDFDALFIPDSAKTAAMILPQLAYYDVSQVFLLGTNLWHSNNLIRLAGKYARDAVIADGFFAGSTYPPVKQFVHRFTEIYGRKPGVIEAFAYDTAVLAMRLLGDPSLKLRSEIRRKLAAAYDSRAVTGPTVFDENGDVHKPLYLMRIKGRKFVELKHP